jgi:hypothetical protein
MAFSLRRRFAGTVGAAALLLALGAMPVQAALVRGDFSDGLYTAPGQLFTVRSPLGSSPRLVDGFDRSVGSVTFMDHEGELFGVICTPDLDILAGADNDFETSQAILRNWFREAAFQSFFAGVVPDAEVLREEPGEFEGQPAWIAVMRLPGAAPSARYDEATGRVTRGDSWRGVVVISRGGHTYLLMTEVLAMAGEGEAAFDASAPGWNGFVAKLAQFYSGMTFQSSEPAAVPGRSFAISR